MNKACPVVLRMFGSDIQLLAFRHPTAGNQIVKGTVEAGESTRMACARELFEESGITGKPETYMGRWEPDCQDQI